MPSAAELLATWEWGLGRSVPERGVALLTALLPGWPTDSLVHMSIGRRDVHLLHAHAALFGPDLDCVVSCPGCETNLELRIAVDDLLDSDGGPGTEPGTELDEGGWRVRFRLIDNEDLIAVAASGDAAAARRTLLDRCVTAALPPGGRETSGLPEGGLPPAVEAALLREMERSDLSDPLELRLTCPDCGLAWTAPFDILGYLWAEIDGWAHRTLREVHLLASAYGWREADVLALSGWRREAYLQMSAHG